MRDPRPLLRHHSPALARELPFLALALFAAWPVWVVAHPPIQDLPQHLATIRALVDFDDPALRFADYYVIELGRTQYLAYYLLTGALAKVLGVPLANRVVLSLAIVGLPYAMRALLRALGRDERAALFVLPLTWNAHLILGFANFVAAIPLALYGLALAIRTREAFTVRRAIGLGVVAVLAFYSHVVPFAFLGLGAAAILVGDGPRETARRLAALVPAAVAAGVWAARSPAGRATLTAAGAGTEGDGPLPVFVAPGDALRNVTQWLTDVLVDGRDEALLAAWGVLLLAAIGLASPRPSTPAVRRARLVVGLLVPLAGAAYFLTPDSYDWIWPINARFPLLALVLLVACLDLPVGLLGHALSTSVALVAVLSFQAVTAAFVAFERDEVGALDEAIAHIPRGARVAGLVFDRGSAHVKFSPFLHSVAWVQAERGGAVMFTFADFPQSPVRFREDQRPPRVGPRWEWMPERVSPSTDLAWYEYVLVRGGPGPIARSPDLRLEFENQPWRVYRRIVRPHL